MTIELWFGWLLMMPQRGLSGQMYSKKAMNCELDINSLFRASIFPIIDPTFLLNEQFTSSFSFFVFVTEKLIWIKFRRWLDLNWGLLVKEVTAQTTETQSLSNQLLFCQKIFSIIYLMVIPSLFFLIPVISKYRKRQ